MGNRGFAWLILFRRDGKQRKCPIKLDMLMGGMVLEDAALALGGAERI